MKPRHWLFAAALVTFMGCDSSNPNEADFPGAPGSRVPAPPPAPAGGMSKGNTGALPSNYPGLEKLRKDVVKKADEAPRPAEADKAPARDEARPAPAKEKEAAKPAAPGDQARPAASR